MRPQQIARLVLLAGVVFNTYGCGSSNPAAPDVSGVVTLDDTPLPGAVVRLLPNDPQSRAATVKTNESGMFIIEPHPTTGETLSPGTYKIVISKVVDQQGNAIEDEDVDQLKAAGMARETLPGKYSRPDMTELKAEIKIDEPNELMFPLSGAG